MDEVLTLTTTTVDNAQLARKKLLVLIGYTEAEEEIYKFKRNNLVVINGKNLFSPEQGGEKMKGIRKRKDGRWEGRLSLNGQRYSVYGKTQKECYEKVKNLKQSFKNAKIEERHAIVNFFGFAQMWLEKYKKPEVSEDTFKVYSNIVNHHLVNIKGKLVEITTTKLQEYLNSEGKTRTKELAYQTLKQIFRKALELDLVKKDVSQFLVKGKVDRKKRVGFTIEEQKLILSNLSNNTVSKYILAYLMLGARLSELKSIKKSNIKNNYVLIEGTKTSNAIRWVKISDKYQQILLNYQEPIFNCQADTIKAKMREFFQKIGIKGSTHMLRHTFATNLYYLGVDDNARKQYLGHSSIVVTNDIYTHLDPTITKQDILNLYGDLYPNF